MRRQAHQMRAVRSVDPVRTSVFSSGVTESTAPLCPRSTFSQEPSCRLQRRSVASEEPETTWVSPKAVTAFTVSLWPLSTRTQVKPPPFFAGSKMRTVLSRDAVASSARPLPTVPRPKTGLPAWSRSSMLLGSWPPGLRRSQTHTMPSSPEEARRPGEG